MLVIIKLGGSVITDKAQAGVIHEGAIAEMAKAIAAADSQVIIVHGAGSLGHPEAAEYHIASGVSSENARGVYVTHAAVSRLNEAVVFALREAGVEAVSFHPFACALAENGRLQFCGEEQIRCLLSAGIVPVLHGDVVCDTKKGGCIVSGDQIVPYLALALKADKIGIVTATGGVLDGEDVIAEITRKNLAAVPFDEAKTADVTGGMKGKVLELLELADAGIASHIFKPEMLPAFLAGEETGGTIVQ